MSARPTAPPELQPENFSFTQENIEQAQKIIAKYPRAKRQSAMLPLLDLAQRQHNNWLPRAAMDYVADFLGVPHIKAYEVATFYTMFNLAPVGQFFVQACTTTPCWLCGSGEVLRALKDKLDIVPGQTSEDGKFSCVEVECLGACVNAPMVQINDEYYEDLNYERMVALIESLQRGEKVSPGSQTGRVGAQAQSGPTSLKNLAPSSVSQQGGA